MTLYKMEVVVTDPIDYNPTKKSISDEKEYENGFEVDVNDAYQ